MCEILRQPKSSTGCQVYSHAFFNALGHEKAVENGDPTYGIKDLFKDIFSFIF